MARHGAHPVLAKDYERIVRSTGPVFYVPLQGAKPYEVVRGAPVTNTNGVLLAQPGPFGSAQAARFSASAADNDRLSVATDPSYHPGDTFSAGGWFNRQGVGSSTEAMLSMGANDFDINFNGSSLAMGKDGVSFVFTVTGSAGLDALWHHLIWTKTGATIICYLDATSRAGVTTNASIVGSAVAPTLGMHTGGVTDDFNGFLSHWAIWNRVLTPGEVRLLFEPAYR